MTTRDNAPAPPDALLSYTPPPPHHTWPRLRHDPAWKRDEQITYNPDGTSHKSIVYTDPRTGIPVAEDEEDYDADGHLVRRSYVYAKPNGDTEEGEDIFQPNGKIRRRRSTELSGGLPKYRSEEDYDDDGQLTDDEESEGEVGVGSTTKHTKYDHGKRTTTTTIKYDAATKTITRTIESYSYDADGRLRRIDVRDEQGKTLKVITIAFYSDGTRTEVTTDYSTAPATVTGVAYDANGVPVRTW